MLYWKQWNFLEKVCVKVPLVRVIFPAPPDRNTLVSFYSKISETWLISFNDGSKSKKEMLTVQTSFLFPY